jgi:hypothetical protein
MISRPTNKSSSEAKRLKIKMMKTLMVIEVMTNLEIMTLKMRVTHMVMNKMKSLANAELLVMRTSVNRDSLLMTTLLRWLSL